MKTLVKDIMKIAVVTVTPQTRVLQAARRLADNDIRHLVVTRADGSVIGLLSQRDIIMHLSPWLTHFEAAPESSTGKQDNQELKYLQAARRKVENQIRQLVVASSDGKAAGLQVHEVMVRKPITITPDATLQTAAQVMGEEKLGCLPVVDQRGQLLGIVTVIDILLTIADQVDEYSPPPGQTAEHADQFEFYKPAAVLKADGSIAIPLRVLPPEVKSSLALVGLGYCSSTRQVAIRFDVEADAPGAREVSVSEKELLIPAKDFFEFFGISKFGAHEVIQGLDGRSITLSPRSCHSGKAPVAVSTGFHTPPPLPVGH